MQTEYIRRQDAKDALQEKVFHNLTDEFYGAMQVLDELPPADVVPVRHAYWIPQKENHEFKEAWMKCSACGYPVSRWTGNTNFCPNCGAIMDAKEKG